MADSPNAFISWWRRFRRNYWLALVFDAGVLLVIIFFIGQWQTRDLLDVGEAGVAPNTILPDLGGLSQQIDSAQSERTLVYFFAPWCGVCAASAHNINALRAARTDDELSIYMVALSWESFEAVEEFAKKHELTVPVLLGNAVTADDWLVHVFPTYYVLDRQGKILHRSVGYSTELGLRFKT